MPPHLDHPLKITPVGGLGEIGMNMMLIELGKDAILVDCGVMFPDQFHPGIDLILPSLSVALNPKINLRAVILTHGHEDHIGALPYLLERKNVPVYLSRFTSELVLSKLNRKNMDLEPQLHVVMEGDRVKCGPFIIEFIEMSHSICDALALCIDTPQGRIIHTGDFKLDDHPADGRKTNIKRFEELGREGVLLLLSDSTNVEVPGKSVSEKTVQEGLKEILHETKGWFVISSFASHIPRIGQVLELAQLYKRKVLVMGRAMRDNIRIASSLDYLNFPDELFIEEKEAKRLPRNKLVVLSTGSQGEPRAALSKLAYDEFHDVKLMKGDNVVLSSRFIPGNEKSIYSIIDHLYRRGAEVFTSKGSDVHVSGHGFKEDLRKMILAVKPQFFIPIHGEYRHLVIHQALAIEAGVDPKNALLLENGERVEFKNNKAKILEPLELTPTYLMEEEVSDLAQDLIRDRRKMGYCGVVSVVAVVDKKSKKLKNHIEVATRGVFFEDQDENQTHQLARLLERALEKNNRNDQIPISEVLSRESKRFFAGLMDRKPVILPLVIEA